MPTDPAKKVILDRRQMARVIRRMADQITELQRGAENLMLVGIRTRGLPLAERIAAEIEKAEGEKVPVGVLDITLYRDDLSTIAPQPVVKETHFPSNLGNHHLVLCDDVLYTGRTVRAALDALIDYGRPRSVRLAVLIDRGHRELPIHADVVGKKISTAPDEIVDVRFDGVDGEDGVWVLAAPEKG